MDVRALHTALHIALGAPWPSDLPGTRAAERGHGHLRAELALLDALRPPSPPRLRLCT